MQALMDWGIELILWVQQLRPTLDLFFKAVTFTGDEMFFLLFMPIFYWCIDRVIGVRMLLLFGISAYINFAAKTLANQPRPFQVTDRVWAYSTESHSGGFPSGHTQGATVMWGYLAWQFRRKWLLILAIVMMVLVPFSRIYLGVHFPHDLLGGYVIGGLVLFAAFRWLSSIERWLVSLGMLKQLGLIAILTVLMAFSLQTENGITATATFFGMGIGFVLERQWIGFETKGNPQQYVFRYLLGMAGLFGLYAGLKIVFAALEPALFFRFIRYGLVGIWLGVGAPWAFVKFGLASANLPEKLIEE
jgi:undecaprenyl-diphosphatase